MATLQELQQNLLISRKKLEQATLQLPVIDQRIGTLEAQLASAKRDFDVYRVNDMNWKGNDLPAQLYRAAEQRVNQLESALAAANAEKGKLQAEINTETRMITDTESQIQIVAAAEREAEQGNDSSSLSAAARAAQEQYQREVQAAQEQVAEQRLQADGGDWRVKLRLAGGADYLYKAPDPGILKPLLATDGVVFPYMPTIAIQHIATYANADLTHSNYRGHFYQGSYIADIQLDAVFTAQDTEEANYLLAVIHFFRSATKMFYGQDAGKYRGAPPPLMFLQGLGEFQFNLVPCVVANFNHTLPNDVDYIRANTAENYSVANSAASVNSSSSRLANAGIPPGGLFVRPSLTTLDGSQITYVPSKTQISLTLIPIQTRAQVSKEFSLRDYASGKLMKKGFW